MAEHLTPEDVINKINNEFPDLNSYFKFFNGPNIKSFSDDIFKPINNYYEAKDEDNQDKLNVAYSEIEKILNSNNYKSIFGNDNIKKEFLNIFNIEKPERENNDHNNDDNNNRDNPNNDNNSPHGTYDDDNDPHIYNNGPDEQYKHSATMHRRMSRRDFKRFSKVKKECSVNGMDINLKHYNNEAGLYGKVKVELDSSSKTYLENEEKKLQDLDNDLGIDENHLTKSMLNTSYKLIELAHKSGHIGRAYQDR